MAKKVTAFIKLQISAGQANPAPPIGPALGQHGVNIMQFCKDFNAKTQDKAGLVIPVVITVYQDRSFTFIMKSPPVATLLKKTVGLAVASGKPNKEKVGKVTLGQVRDIARQKMTDLNTKSEDAAMKMVMGTARSMGIDVVNE